ncbi:hypothetical protein U0070_008294, partial [Myodes glareolus]
SAPGDELIVGPAPPPPPARLRPRSPLPPLRRRRRGSRGLGVQDRGPRAGHPPPEAPARATLRPKPAGKDGSGRPGRPATGEAPARPGAAPGAWESGPAHPRRALAALPGARRGPARGSARGRGRRPGEPGRARGGLRGAGRREGGRGARLRGEKVLRPRAAPPGKLSRIPATAGPGGREAGRLQSLGDFGGTLIVDRPEGVRAPGAELKALAAEAEKGGYSERRSPRKPANVEENLSLKF